MNHPTLRSHPVMIVTFVLDKSMKVAVEFSFDRVVQCWFFVGPDVVINLPNKRHIIIDAKVSLLAYYKSINSNDMHEKAHFNQEFIASVLKQINDLSSKEYYRSNELNSIDFVIMFMPIESAYISLVNSHPEIINTASKKNIS